MVVDNKGSFGTLDYDVSLKVVAANVLPSRNFSLSISLSLSQRACELPAYTLILLIYQYNAISKSHVTRTSRDGH